jgi:hypothetical protein
MTKIWIGVAEPNVDMTFDLVSDDPRYREPGLYAKHQKRLMQWMVGRRATIAEIPGGGLVLEVEGTFNREE